MRSQNTNPKTTLVIILVVGLLMGIVGGIIGAFFFARPGPEGPAGPQGATGATGAAGERGLQGTPGIQGLDGTNAILQVVQSQNVTQIGLGTPPYALDRWYNMSVADNSMRITIDVQDQSRIYAEFLSSVNLDDIASLRLRIVVDNQFNSTVCMVGILTPSAVAMNLPAQVKIVTGALSAGQHTVDVQFFKDDGTPIILDRSLVVMELASS